MADALEKLDWNVFLSFVKRYIKTEQGLHFLEGFSPAFSYEEALRRQQEAKELFSFLKAKGLEGLPRLKSIKASVKRAARGGTLSPEELFHIKRALETGLTFEDLSFFPSLDPLRPLLQELNRCLESSGEDLRDEASPELYHIRKRLKELFERLHSFMEELLRKYAKAGVLRENLVFQRKGRLVLPVRSEHKSKVAGILHDTSQSGATVFIEPVEVIPVSNELEALRIEEERVKKRILKRLSEEVARLEASLLELEEALGKVDVLVSALKLSELYEGRFPELRASANLYLKGAAHPFFLLEGRDCVRNDFRLKKGASVLVISGPNFGGKTVALKTLGISVLLAQAGLPVAAEEGSVVPVFKSVLADIGDDQGILSQESSFSAHLKLLSKILTEASPETLVLLDEPGRGTDPREGAALAFSVLKTLKEKGAFVVATTHYPELKHLAFASQGFVSAFMELDEKRGLPTYRLTYGGLGSSYGLSFARRFLPEEVVKEAEEVLKREKVDEVLVRLKGLEEELKNTKKRLEEERRRLEAEKRDFEREKRKLKAELEEEKRALRKKFEEFTGELEKKLKEIEVVSKEGARGVREAVKECYEKRREAEEVFEDEAWGVSEVRPGQRVFVKEFKAEATVIKDLGEKVEVSLGAFRVAVPKKSIKVVSDEESRPSVRVRVVEVSDQEVSESLYLLGLRVEEAIPLLDKFIDRAILAGKREVKIVHGLGTGRLKNAVRDFLANHEAVEALREGAPFEGGAGVTIVTLSPKKEAV